MPLFLLVTDVRLTLCQRRYLEHSRNPRPDKEIPRCRPDGSFEEVQCRGVICFCVDPDNGRAVKETNINTLFGEPRCGETGKKPKSTFIQKPKTKTKGNKHTTNRKINKQNFQKMVTFHVFGNRYQN